mmetsp:Transcript_36639/g.85876  ORF Transcript_36639/g.85876 Transcript_36639/m.85876 type:complete len:668 (-) Transcript_36639:155-2158(-)
METEAPLPPPKQGAAHASGDSGIRRRPVPVHYDWHVAQATDEEGERQQDEFVFEEEAPSKFQEYLSVFCDYVFWILLAYCVCNLLLWIGEKMGLVSPHFEEWSPVRWFHHDPHGLHKQLFENATAGSTTVVQFEGLKRWIEGGPGGWVNPKLMLNDYFSERGRYDRRLEVSEGVEKDEVLVKLPLSHVLSSDFCQQDLTDNNIRKVVEASKKNKDGIEIAAWTWITLYMIAHAKGADTTLSTWRFDSLLKSEYIDATLSYIPLFWDDSSLHWLNGTDLLNIHILDVHAAIESEYHKLTYLVPAVEASIPIIEFKKWAMVVMSRGETVDLPDRENKTRMTPKLALMPLIDLVDHHLPLPERPLATDEDLLKYQETGSHTNISYNPDIAAVVLVARESLDAKAAVTSAYGVRSSADYLLYHGFTMPHSWSDLTLCTQYTLIELPLPADTPGWKWRFLEHPYRFAVPACPNHKSTPHIVVGAARFLSASEQDVLDFESRLNSDPSLLEGYVPSKDSKFLQHGATEAISIACDTKVQPPVCRAPMSIENERAAWSMIKKQTLARVQQHVSRLDEDERLLAEDDELTKLTLNQRHAVIVRREEKLTLRQWCALSVKISSYLESAGPEAVRLERIPDTETMHNEEPRARPQYWKTLLEKIPEADIPSECRMGK